MPTAIISHFTFVTANFGKITLPLLSEAGLPAKENIPSLLGLICLYLLGHFTKVIKKRTSTAVKSKQIIATSDESCLVVRSAIWGWWRLEWGINHNVCIRGSCFKQGHFSLSIGKVHKTATEFLYLKSLTLLLFLKICESNCHHQPTSLCDFFFFKDLNQIKLKCHGRNSAHYKTVRQQITSTSEELPWNFSTNGSDWKTVPHQCVPVHVEVQIRPEHQNAHAQNMQM